MVLLVWGGVFLFVIPVFPHGLVGGTLEPRLQVVVVGYVCFVICGIGFIFLCVSHWRLMLVDWRVRLQ